MNDQSAVHNPQSAMCRVALIMERIETWRGGAETSTMQFAQHLARLGCQVTVLTTTHAQSTHNLKVVPIRAGSTLRASKTMLFARRAAAYVRANPFDIVHSITPCSAADVYQPRGGTVPETLERNLALRSGALQRGMKDLAQRLSLKYRIVGRLERKLLRRRPPPFVIAISQYVADQLAKHYQFDPARIRLVFNGVDPDLTSADDRSTQRRQIRKQFDLADDDLVALCVAHNFKLKGVHRLIEALAHLRSAANAGSYSPDAARSGALHAHAGPGSQTGSSGIDVASARADLYVVIVGRDDLTPFARLAEQLGVADRVFFSGPTQRIGAFFHAADLLVHPTFYDPCSRVVLEALAAGLPVITTRFNGAAERITDGREGYVIDSPDDVDALADRIDRLLDDEHRRDCAARAPSAVEDFSMARHAERVLALYEDILRNGDPRKAGYR